MIFMIRLCYFYFKISYKGKMFDDLGKEGLGIVIICVIVTGMDLCLLILPRE